MSLLPENIDRFRRELSRQIELHRDENVQSGLLIDADVKFDQLNLALAEEINRLAPFGNGNPMPQFLSRGLNVVDDQRIGREGKHRKLHVQAEGSPFKLPVLWFDGADAELPPGTIDLLYSLSINEYKGDRSLQLSFVALRPTQPETVAVQSRKSGLRIEDLRKQVIDPADLPQPATAFWYAEGALLEADHNKVAYSPRTTLRTEPQPLAPLVLWSIPPSPDLLDWMIETSAASQVYLCGRETSDDSLDSVLKNVAEGVIRHSLLWLESRGLIRIEHWLGGDSLRISEGAGNRRADESEELKAQLQQKLAEVRAYRRFFLRAKISELGI